MGHKLFKISYNWQFFGQNSFWIVSLFTLFHLNCFIYACKEWKWQVISEAFFSASSITSFDGIIDWGNSCCNSFRHGCIHCGCPPWRCSEKEKDSVQKIEGGTPDDKDPKQRRPHRDEHREPPGRSPRLDHRSLRSSSGQWTADQRPQSQIEDLTLTTIVLDRTFVAGNLQKDKLVWFLVHLTMRHTSQCTFRFSPCWVFIVGF